MGRKSKRETITQAVHDYLAQAEQQPPDVCPMDVGSVAAAVGCARSSIYNYGLQEAILAAAQRQQTRKVTVTATVHDLIRELRDEIMAMETRNRALLERLNLVEVNATRLGVDANDLYRPLFKPPREVSGAGRGRKL